MEVKAFWLKKKLFLQHFGILAWNTAYVLAIGGTENYVPKWSNFIENWNYMRVSKFEGFFALPR
jgi:hypothetical protein